MELDERAERAQLDVVGMALDRDDARDRPWVRGPVHRSLPSCFSHHPRRSPRCVHERPSCALRAAASSSRWTANPSEKSGRPSLRSRRRDEPAGHVVLLAEDVPVRVMDRAAPGAREILVGDRQLVGLGLALDSLGGQSLSRRSVPALPWRSISWRWPNGPGSYASDVTWMLPRAPFSNSGAASPSPRRPRMALHRSRLARDDA